MSAEGWAKGEEHRLWGVGQMGQVGYGVAARFRRGSGRAENGKRSLWSIAVPVLHKAKTQASISAGRQQENIGYRTLNRSSQVLRGCRRNEWTNSFMGEFQKEECWPCGRMNSQRAEARVAAAGVESSSTIASKTGRETRGKILDNEKLRGERKGRADR